MIYNQDERVLNAFHDVASTVHQPLVVGGEGVEGGEGDEGGEDGENGKPREKAYQLDPKQQGAFRALLSAFHRTASDNLLDEHKVGGNRNPTHDRHWTSFSNSSAAVIENKNSTDVTKRQAESACPVEHSP
jgi:hypothetical protein